MKREEEQLETGNEPVAISAGEYLEMGEIRQIDAYDLYLTLHDDTSANDPYILDIRDRSLFEAGHIPGSVNIGLIDLFTNGSLSELPKNKEIVVVCDIGQTASFATALLNVNGYFTKSLKWGMTSWTTNSLVSPDVFSKADDSYNYPVSFGIEPGDVDTAEIADTYSVIRAAADEYMNSGRNTFISAAALYNNLVDSYSGNDPFILSVRTEQDYELGHIPGAIHIPYDRLFTEDNISLLPKNRQIVVYGDTGHFESQVTAMLNILGFDAMALKWGISSWTLNTTVAPEYFDLNQKNDFTFSTGYELPTRQGCLEDFGEGIPGWDSVIGAGFEILRPICESYMALGGPTSITAEEVHGSLAQSNSSEAPYLLDIRDEELYLAGHIPGSFHKEFTKLFREETLGTLPKNRQIVIICSTGKAASQVTPFLGMLGYNALPLKWGMTAWTTNTSAAPWRYDREGDTHDYPFVNGSEPGDFPSTTVTAGEIILTATQDLLNSGKNMLITAEALYSNLIDGFTGNDPFILSIRDYEEYVQGHIPGAVNIPFRSVFTKENISKLPMNKQIVVYGNTPHAENQITGLLGVLGYDAVYLNWGICSWSTDPEISHSCYDRGTDANDYPFTTGLHPGVMPSTRMRTRMTECIDEIQDVLQDVPEGSATDLIRNTCDIFMKGDKNPAVSAQDLYANLTDDKSALKPYIIDVRSLEYYEAGHIPGSVHMVTKDLFTEENLDALPADRQIVVVCYYGNKGSRLAAFLNINGHDAVALEWGMTSWTINATVAPEYYDPDIDGNDYPIFVGEEPGDVQSVLIDVERTILSATRGVLASGKKTFTTAEALYANLWDGFVDNDPYIISLQSEDLYKLGHIPTAVNIPFRSVFTKENLSGLPTTRQIVVYCTSGHASSQTAALLRLLGYDALNLKWGMCSWTTNTEIAPGCYDAEEDAKDYPFINSTSPGNMPKSRAGEECGDDEYDGPGGEIDWDLAANELEILRQASDGYMGDGKAVFTTAESLYTLLTDSNQSNDPFLLDIRLPEYYEAGHIPGSVNIEMSGLFKKGNLSSLPTNRQIAVICYLGQTGGEAAAYLNVNGFDAVALKWGMTSWTKNTTVAPWRYNWGWDTQNYPVVIGSLPRSISYAKVAGKTQEEMLQEATRKYIDNGLRMFVANDLMLLLSDVDTTIHPFVLSIRSPAEYALGHIPGAVNIPWRCLFTNENLSKLPSDDKKIVVVDDNGHMAGQITALLNVLGFNASSLEFGMSSWTRNTTIVPGTFNKSQHQKDYPTESSMRSRSSVETRQCGDNEASPEFTGSSYEWEILRRAVEEYVEGIVSETITAEAVYNSLYDNYSANDPFVVDMRTTGDYAFGHIRTAVNIEEVDILKASNLAILPKDKQIIAYCHRGQQTGHAVAMLNLIGYNAIPLEYGMCSWTGNVSLIGTTCYDPATDGHNFRVSKGSEPGEWATALPAD
jgi:rhodanese-related sulfurtransferase